MGRDAEIRFINLNEHDGTACALGDTCESVVSVGPHLGTQQPSDLLVYLASPYSHPDPKIVEARFRAVCKEAARLMRQGVFLYSPIAHTHPLAVYGMLPGSWDFWERYDQMMMDRCDELWILCLDGWQRSTGVTAETDWAYKAGKYIKYVIPEEDVVAGS